MPQLDAADVGSSRHVARCQHFAGERPFRGMHLGRYTRHGGFAGRQSLDGQVQLAQHGVLLLDQVEHVKGVVGSFLRSRQHHQPCQFTIGFLA
ncbi:ATP-binding protein [Pseudoduganella sp. R-43]